MAEHSAIFPGIHLLDPLYIKMSDEFFITEEEEQKLVDRVGKADIFIFTGMRGEGIMKEFAMRYHVPGSRRRNVRIYS